MPVSVYSDSFRRKFIDTAGKMMFWLDKLIMKVPMVDFVLTAYPVFRSSSSWTPAVVLKSWSDLKKTPIIHEISAYEYEIIL